MVIDLKEFIEELKQSNGNLQQLLETKLEEIKQIKERERLPEEIAYIRGQLDILQIRDNKVEEILARGRASRDRRIRGGENGSI